MFARRQYCAEEYLGECNALSAISKEYDLPVLRAMEHCAEPWLRSYAKQTLLKTSKALNRKDAEADTMDNLFSMSFPKYMHDIEIEEFPDTTEKFAKLKKQAELIHMEDTKWASVMEFLNTFAMMYDKDLGGAPPAGFSPSKPTLPKLQSEDADGSSSVCKKAVVVIPGSSVLPTKTTPSKPGSAPKPPATTPPPAAPLAEPPSTLPTTVPATPTAVPTPPSKPVEPDDIAMKDAALIERVERIRQHGKVNVNLIKDISAGKQPPVNTSGSGGTSHRKRRSRHKKSLFISDEAEVSGGDDDSDNTPDLDQEREYTK